MPLMQRNPEVSGGLALRSFPHEFANDEISSCNCESSSDSQSNNSGDIEDCMCCSNNNNNNNDPHALTTPMLKNSGSGSSKESCSPVVAKLNRSSRRRLRSRLTKRLHGAMALVTAMGLIISVLGLPWPDRSLPELKPLPENPLRAFATLHSDSNPCYDMLLYVCVSSWKETRSKYPLLLLHSVPLPPKVHDLVYSQQPPQTATSTKTLPQQQPNAGMIIPVSIPKRTNYFVVKDRVRTAAAKFAVWDQTAYDQVAYHDSDTIFFENGDSIFDAPIDKEGNLGLYSLPYKKYWDKGVKVFNSGNFLIRPSKRVYRKILDLFQRRFWILPFQQFLKTADQGFLNAVFPYQTWDFLEKEKLARVKHVKFWLAKAGDEAYGITEQDKAQAHQIADKLDLHDDLEMCLHHRRYSA